MYVRRGVALSGEPNVRSTLPVTITPLPHGAKLVPMPRLPCAPPSPTLATASAQMSGPVFDSCSSPMPYDSASLSGALHGMVLRPSGGIELGTTELRAEGELLRLSGHYGTSREDEVILEVEGLSVDHLAEYMDTEFDAAGRFDVRLELRGDIDRHPHLYARGQLHGGRWLTVDPIEIEHAWAEFEPGDLAAAAEVRFGDRGTFVLKVVGTPDDQQSDIFEALAESAYYVDISTRSMDLALSLIHI